MKLKKMRKLNSKASPKVLGFETHDIVQTQKGILQGVPYWLVPPSALEEPVPRQSEVLPHKAKKKYTPCPGRRPIAKPAHAVVFSAMQSQHTRRESAREAKLNKA